MSVKLLTDAEILEYLRTQCFVRDRIPEDGPIHTRSLKEYRERLSQLIATPQPEREAMIHRMNREEQPQ